MYGSVLVSFDSPTSVSVDAAVVVVVVIVVLDKVMDVAVRVSCSSITGVVIGLD